MKDRIATEEDVDEFDPNFGPCCGIEDFRLHFDGTPCDTWNKSATEVFLNSFFEKYTEYSPEKEPVVRLVKFKTHSALAAMIKKYRRRGPDGNVDPETSRSQRRQERKRKVCSYSLISCLRGCGLFLF